MRLRRSAFLLAGTTVIVAACSGSTTPNSETCEGFPDWVTSPYVLPYPKGPLHS